MYLSFSRRKWLVIFYVALVIINFIQAFYTPLFFDEAYYWIVSQNMDWGHYYHPPMIDLFSSAGYFLLPNELGLRLFYCLATGVAIIVWERLLQDKDDLLYICILSSLLFFPLGGVFAVPDIALLLWAVIFYVLLNRFVRHPQLWHSVGLGLLSAMMIYTKYHSVLLICPSFLFLIPRLYKRSIFYLWPLVALVLLIPHVWWQYEQGFPTVIYHLFERSGTGSRSFGVILGSVLEYPLGQVLFVGPIIGFLLFYGALRYKAKTPFYKLLKFNLFFFYLYWWIVAFFHHVEINWGLLGMIPLVVLAHQYWRKTNLRKWLYWTMPVSVVLMLIFRIVFMFPEHFTFIPRINIEFVGWPTWAKQIDSVAGDCPLVINGRYQESSMLSFYSEKHFCDAINSTQHNDFIRFFPYEERLQSQEVCYISPSRIDATSDSLMTTRGMWHFKKIKNYRSYHKVKLKEVSKSKEQGTHRLVIQSPYPYTLTFKENPNMPSFIVLRMWPKNGAYQDTIVGDAQDFLSPRTVNIYDYGLPQNQSYRYQFFIHTIPLAEVPCSFVFEHSPIDK